ncbi:MAG: hypothetical protein MJ053_04820 [Elusimicrobiaceae bacterium]|nr:hypothetical protein [Elusimicrobiaceae bacterium]
MSPLQENIQLAVNQISDYLTKNKTATSWQLKVLLRLSSSVLYLALGALYEQHKISLEADGINYHVTWGQKPENAVSAAPTALKENM